jgi:DNA primase
MDGQDREAGVQRAGRARSRPGSADAHRVTELARVHQAAARFFRGRRRDSWVPAYLTGRRLAAALQRDWQAGYAPAGRDALVRHLRALGYGPEAVQAAGLAHRTRGGALTDTFHDRAMLPIHTADGTIIAFIGRAGPRAPPQLPKYLNSPATALYRKRDVLFGLWQAGPLLRGGARPVIVEGPFDAIAVTVAGAGRYAGLSPCGTAFTPQQAAALARIADLRRAGVIVAFDPDPAGRRAAITAYHRLSLLTDIVLTAILPAGHDPADILAHRGPAALARAVSEHTVPLADLVVDAEVDRWNRWLDHAEGQINALRAAARVIAAMPPAHIGRQAARLAQRLGLPCPTVTEAITSALHDLPGPRAVARPVRRR